MDSELKKGWLLIIAIGLSFVALGAILDFLLRKRQVKWLHNFFLKLSKALKELPLTEWQVKIAQRYVSFFTELKFIENLVNGVAFLATFPFKNFFKMEEYSLPLSPMRFILFLYGALIGCSLGILMLFLFSQSKYSWLFMSISPLSILCLYSLFLCLTDKFLNPVSILINSLIASVILTSSAQVFSVSFIPEKFLNTSWFVFMDNYIVPTRSMFITTINYLFDFLTIIISLLLLKIVIKQKKYICIVAIVDIAISAILTVILYSILLLIQNGTDVSGICVCIKQSSLWFYDLFAYLIANIRNIETNLDLYEIRDLHLLPMLLTTFVPVVCYMSIFLFISFCKPIMLFASTLFGAMGEKDESVFKQFGFLIATIMATVKAIYDYLTI